MVSLVLAIIVNYIIVSIASSLIFIPFTLVADGHTVYTFETYILPYLPIIIMFTLCGLAFTPMGEAFFRFLHKARGPLKSEQEKIESIFAKIVKSAGFERNKFDLLVCDDQQINAYAMGRRSIIITRGALRLPDNEIEAIFAHELGHMKNHDSIRTLMYYLVSSVTKVAIAIMAGISAVLAIFKHSRIFGIIIGVITTMLVWLVIKPLHIGDRFGGRLCEYRADRFACEIGYADGMYCLISRFLDMEGTAAKGVNSLMATHPGSGKRLLAIEKFQEKK